jgi:hypothetical protein
LNDFNGGPLGVRAQLRAGGRLKFKRSIREQFSALGNDFTNNLSDNLSIAGAAGRGIAQGGLDVAEGAVHASTDMVNGFLDVSTKPVQEMNRRFVERDIQTILNSNLSSTTKSAAIRAVLENLYQAPQLIKDDFASDQFVDSSLYNRGLAKDIGGNSALLLMSLLPEIQGGVRLAGTFAVDSGSLGSRVVGNDALEKSANYLKGLGIELRTNANAKLKEYYNAAARKRGYPSGGSASGYYDPKERTLYLKSDVTYTTLLHELAHARFAASNEFRALTVAEQERFVLTYMRRDNIWGMLSPQEKISHYKQALMDGVDLTIDEFGDWGTLEKLK